MKKLIVFVFGIILATSCESESLQDIFSRSKYQVIDIKDPLKQNYYYRDKKLLLNNHTGEVWVFDIKENKVKKLVNKIDIKL